MSGDVTALVERLRADLEKQPWAKGYRYNIVPSGGPAHRLACDAIRERFDAWIARIDPNGELDDYQRGRLWLRDDPCGLMADSGHSGSYAR